MDSKRIPALSVFLFLTDLGLVLIGMFVSSELRSIIPLGAGGALPAARTQVPPPVYLLALICWSIGLVSSGAYSPQRVLRWFNEAWRLAWGSGVGTVLMAGVLYMSYRELSRLQFAYFFAVSLGLLLFYRGGLRLYYRLVGKTRPGGQNRILVLGAGELGVRVAKVLLDHSRWGFQVVGFLDDDLEKRHSQIHGLPVLGAIEDLRKLAEADRLDEVWIALPVAAHQRVTDVVRALERLPVRVKVVPDYYSLALVKAHAEILGGIPVIGLREPLIEGLPRLIKRAFDILVTVLLLIPGMPLMGLIAAFIRLDSRGAAVLRQKRVGENGRIFDMVKFRTMIAGAEHEPVQMNGAPENRQNLHKRKDDPRVTRIGRFLRRYSLDELPQFLNVIKGDMSLVGPRPEMPWLVDRYESWQRKRFAVPQGITGWWQINGRSDRPMHLNTEDDLYYVYNYSLWLDIWILLRTPLAVMRGQGAF